MSLANQFALSAVEVFDKDKDDGERARTLAIIAIALALTEPKEILDTDLSKQAPPLSAASALK